VQETFCDDEQKIEETLNLITRVKVESAHNSDANALMPAIESTQRQNLKPKELKAVRFCATLKALGVRTSSGLLRSEQRK